MIKNLENYTIHDAIELLCLEFDLSTDKIGVLWKIANEGGAEELKTVALLSQA